MDGYVIIGTELDTKQLEQDLKNAKKELSQFQKEEERLLKEKGKVELQLSAYDEEKAKIKANTDEMMKKAETEAQVTNLLNMESIELDELTQKYSKQFTSKCSMFNLILIDSFAFPILLSIYCLIFFIFIISSKLNTYFIYFL